MAIISAALVFPLLPVDGLHLFLESHFINELFHLTMVVVFVLMPVQTYGGELHIIVRRQHGRIVTGEVVRSSP